MQANPAANAYVVSGLVENKRREDIERFGGPAMAAALGGFGVGGGFGGGAGEEGDSDEVRRFFFFLFFVARL